MSKTTAADAMRFITEAESNIEDLSATVGVLTEIVKQVGDKLPLQDLLSEVGKLLSSELGPAYKILKDKYWAERVDNIKRWANLYVDASEITATAKASHGDGSNPALQIVLTAMADASIAHQRMAESINKSNQANSTGKAG